MTELIKTKATEENSSMMDSLAILSILQNVEVYFKKNNGGSANIQKAAAAVKKAISGLYGLCRICSHVATSEEIYRRPFFCSECGHTFV